MIEEFTQHALSNGEEGKKWLDSIPSLIKYFEEKWSINVDPPYKLSYNYVAPATKPDGTKAVLKIGFPKDKEFQTEIDALTLFNGEGIEQIYEKDKENAAMLLELVSPGIPLSSLENDEEATRHIASVMKKLWKPVPPQNNFITISEWTKDLFQVRDWYHGKTGPFPEHLIDKAQELFTHLISTQENVVLTHGDLHHDNVLSSQDAWLAIDPKGIVAEPCYEVAAMIRNPYEKLKNIADLKPLLSQRIKILSHELRFDPMRIHGWCLAQTVLSAVWNMEGVKGGEHALRVAQALYELKT